MDYIKKTGWMVGENFFLNKWAAIEYAMENPTFDYRAYCNDDEWNTADWRQEPKESIEELEADRCYQLRKKYKTLVLYYSGGVDSHTVLQNFIKNQIPLDYICLWYTEKYDAPYNKDIHLAEEYLKQNRSKLLGAKILVDKKLTHKEGNGIFSFSNDIKKINWQLRFHHIGADEQLRIRYPMIYDEINQDGCIITGSSKPYVYKDSNGRYFSQNVDRDDENWGQANVEMFWYSDASKLQIKQCHLAKNWLKENKKENTNLIYKSDIIDDFWNLNKHIGRQSFDNFFHKKWCFGKKMEDIYFSQHYGVENANKVYVEYFNSFFKNTYEYYALAKTLSILSTKDKRFIQNYQALGWCTSKKFLD